uniref:Uncharacterized protein n=1 Tax=Panagrolaimus sp. PS1159 TaxID=55785 RepID=A0AC35FEC6_9BILA
MDQDNQNGVAVSSWNSGDIEPPPPKKARMCNNIVEVLPANDDIPKISKGCTFVDYWKKKADEANDYDKPNCKTYFISFDDISFVEPLKLTEVEENVVKEMGENVNQIQTNQNITTLTYSKFQGLIIELDLKKNLISYDYLYTKEEYEEWKKEYNKAQIEDNDVEENVKDDEDDLI